MGRGEIGTVGPAFFQLRRVHSIFIHRDVDNFPPQIAKGLGGFGITGLFHGVHRLGGQEAAKQSEQIFHPCANQNLVRLALNAPVLVKITAQGLAQAQISLGFPFGQKLSLSHHFPGELAPGGKGKGAGVGGAGGAVKGEGSFGRLGRRWGRKGPLRCRKLRQRTDIKTAFGCGTKVAFGGKHLVSGIHCVDAHRKMLGQGALGRQFFPGLQPAFLNFFQNMPVELKIIRLAPGSEKGKGDVAHDKTLLQM